MMKRNELNRGSRHFVSTYFFITNIYKQIKVYGNLFYIESGNVLRNILVCVQLIRNIQTFLENIVRRLISYSEYFKHVSGFVLNLLFVDGNIKLL